MVKILLSANSNKEYYIDAVNGSGGTAVAQYCPEPTADYDGLILCGGNDISPQMYGEQINGAVELDKKRDCAELELLKLFMEAKKPVMGICRGHQLINIALGGSLYQDIAEAAIHKNGTDFYCVHNVVAQKGSICGNLYGESFSVNSSHHQAIKALADDLKATVVAGDLIEGFEHKDLPVFGVQFHPERMCFSQKRSDAVDGSKIFEYFINLCKQNKM